jgi:hypothetical protein
MGQSIFRVLRLPTVNTRETEAVLRKLEHAVLFTRTLTDRTFHYSGLHVMREVTTPWLVGSSSSQISQTITLPYWSTIREV